MSDWFSAQAKINANILIGTDLNTSFSSFRKIKSICTDINNERYGYFKEKGFEVSIGQSTKVKIPWSMLEKCFAALSSTEGYSGKFFREFYPQQAKDNPCHVHVVGQIFVVSGLANTENRKYFAKSPVK